MLGEQHVKNSVALRAQGKFLYQVSLIMTDRTMHIGGRPNGRETK
jgi:hypothetical protein